MEEVDKCLRMDAKQKEVDDEIEQARELLGIGSDGWTSNERYDKARELNDQLKALQMKGMTETIKLKTLEYWPFEDHEENISSCHV